MFELEVESQGNQLVESNGGGGSVASKIDSIVLQWFVLDSST